jgi:hypothetical protein
MEGTMMHSSSLGPHTNIFADLIVLYDVFHAQYQHIYHS